MVYTHSKWLINHIIQIKGFKPIAAIAVVACCLGSEMPAQANWGSSGSAAQGMAMAYCSARAAGKDHKGAVNDASAVTATGMTGDFTSNIASLLVGGKQMWQTTWYVAKQMCPEYFGLLPGQNCPPFQPDPGHQTSCQTAKIAGKWITTGVIVYPNGQHASPEGHPMIAICEGDCAQQGLRPGDYIVSWNEQPFTKAANNRPGSWFQDGETFNVRIKRSRRVFDVTLTSRLGIYPTISQQLRTGVAANLPPKPSLNCWTTYLDDNPAMKTWAEANPDAAAQNKKRFDDC